MSGGSLAKTAASGGASMLPEVLAFTTSLAEDMALFSADVVGSIAHARMLAAQGIIKKEEARAIIKGLRGLHDRWEQGTLTLPEEEDVHMAVERALQADIGDAAKVLHAARSRNDQVALDLRLFLRESAKNALAEIATLVRYLATRAAASTDVFLPSYTHRQRAQPISLAFLLAGYAEAFTRDLDTFGFALSSLSRSPLGSGASSGTSLPIDRDNVRAALGFDALSGSAIDTVGDRDFALDYAYATSKLLVHVSRVSTDMVDFATSEFGFVKLSSGIAMGSSMMPQKRNPDLFELLRGKSGKAIGGLMQLLTTMKGLPFGYNRDQQEDRGPILSCAALSSAAPKMLALGLANVEFDKERCLMALTSDMTQATDLAEALVSRGVPFRESHGIVGSLVSMCKERGYSLLTVPEADARGIDPRLTAEVLATADVAKAIDRKASPGGTSKARVEEHLTRLLAAADAAERAHAKVPALGTLVPRLSEDVS